MKLWLLIALNFGCLGVLLLLARFEAFSWLMASEANGSSPMTVKISQGVYTLMLFMVPALIFANAVMPEGVRYFKLHRPVPIVPMILGVAGILVSVFFIDLLYTWNQSLVTDPQSLSDLEENRIAVNYMMQMPALGDLLVALLANALIPAVAEELFFRGGVQQLIGEWTKKPHLAIVIAAAFFSFLHFDPSGFIVRFVLGVLLGYLFYWSGSLRLAIAAHFFFNAFEVINIYWAQHHPGSAWTQMETTYTLAAISFAIGLGALVTCRNLLLRKSTGVQ